MGYGDEIMASAEIRAAKEKNPESQIVVGDGSPFPWVEQQSLIFQNNPNVTHPKKVQASKPITYVKNFPGRRPYAQRFLSDRIIFSNYRPAKGNIFFSEEEAEKLKSLQEKFSKYVLLNPHVKGSFSGANKDWGIKKWKALSQTLKDQNVNLIQVELNQEAKLPECEQFKTQSFRDMCLLISAVDVVVTSEGGVHHAAAALDKNAVVIFGGRSSPYNLGYDFHRNIYVDGPESPCGKNVHCDHCRTSMNSISVELVSQQAQELQ